MFALQHARDSHSLSAHLGSALAVGLHVEHDASPEDTVDGHDLIDWNSEQLVREEAPTRLVERLVWPVVMKAPNEPLASAENKQ